MLPVLQHHWVVGALTYQNRKVEPRAIGRTALFTVEGEKDDICAIGQTLAAHDLCTSLRPYRKRHHMQAGVGQWSRMSRFRATKASFKFLAALGQKRNFADLQKLKPTGRMTP
jgi:poly-beta-hydroxyalkanoate depolymerase